MEVKVKEAGCCHSCSNSQDIVGSELELRFGFRLKPMAVYYSYIGSPGSPGSPREFAHPGVTRRKCGIKDGKEECAPANEVLWSSENTRVCIYRTNIQDYCRIHNIYLYIIYV